MALTEYQKYKRWEWIGVDDRGHYKYYCQFCHKVIYLDAKLVKPKIWTIIAEFVKKHVKNSDTLYAIFKRKKEK